MRYLLFNPLSGCGKAKEEAELYSTFFSENNQLCDMTEIQSYKDFLATLNEEDEIYIFGGDGTLCRFINGIGNLHVKNNIYYYPCGTGNDFSVDVGKRETKEPFLINHYIKKLPIVKVNGQEYKFINGVGFGIDGYCCQVGDELKKQNTAPNYTSIAIKGLLRDFKPVNATVTVDGRRISFKKVWIAPTMFGRYYGGGMMPTPKQKRTAKEKNVSLMVFHGSSKLKTLMIFPSIFKGTHIRCKKNVAVLKGKNITVKFDRPTPLQIDGETFLDVTEYSVSV